MVLPEAPRLWLSRAKVHDADGIHQVMNGIVAEGGARNQGVEEMTTPDAVAQWIRTLEGRGALFLARHADRPAGAAAFEPGEEPGTARLRVWVLPEFRRQGIGTELSEVALGYGRRLGYKRVVGHVPKENEAALSFFSAVAGMANLNPESLRFELPLE